MKKRVLAALSGGMDSAAAAVLLKEQGFEVLGAIMKLWNDSTGEKHSCGSPNDVEDAENLAKKLGIEFISLDLSKEFADEIYKYFIDEYLKGRTPNPCVRCNARVKFGLFVKKLESFGLNFDYIATGHYAYSCFDEDKQRFCLKLSKDQKKDQTYFLSQLSQEQISKTIFPLGKLTKTEVKRMLAFKNIKLFEKRESQDFKAGKFLLNGINSKPGDILLLGAGKLGTHKGICGYTIGQRKGLGVSYSKPLYVVKTIPELNQIVLGEEKDLFKKECYISHINFVSFLFKPGDEFTGEIKIRAVHPRTECFVKILYEDKALVTFKVPQKSVTPGQAAVIYIGDYLALGGIID